MKKLIFILMAMAITIAPACMEAQNQITRPSKKKTEQTSENKPGKSAPGKRTQKPLSELDPVIQNLINNMVYVEGGLFMMGSNAKDAESAEQPVHKEVIKNFRIGRYEVTQKEWEVVMGTNPSHMKGDELPVDNLVLEDCLRFIKKLNDITGIKFRLPTEAEWEYTARGGSKSKGYKFSGSNDLDKVAWVKKNSQMESHKIGSKSPNELGIYDMTGNVWEFTSDRVSSRYDQPRNWLYNICRGGGWDSPDNMCRITYRAYDDPNISNESVGMRLAL